MKENGCIMVPLYTQDFGLAACDLSQSVLEFPSATCARLMSLQVHEFYCVDVDSH
eukprot:COSAG02_NODE_4_length_69935_cov_46.806590_19_plen_55_part_00